MKTNDSNAYPSPPSSPQPALNSKDPSSTAHPTPDSQHVEGLPRQGEKPKYTRLITTSTTTVVGLLPLAFSEVKWFPLCMAIIFGLVAATFIALLVVPGLYLQLTPKTPAVEEG